MQPARTSKRDDVNRYMWLGLAAVVLLVLGGGGWAALAALRGAVIAAGTVVVESYAKDIQHPEGGVVGDIFVRNGQKVKAGDVLLRLDDTITRANLMVVDSQLIELGARRARLEAEQDGHNEPVFSRDLLARRGEENVARAIEGEAKLFASRRSALDGQIAQLRSRIGQFEDEAAGLEAQIEAKSSELAIIAEEIAAMTDLLARELTPVTRVRAVQRQRIGIEGERGQLQAQLASLRGRISETELQIIQLGQDMRSEATKELREIEAKWAELQERRIAAKDRLMRVELRAPISGIVHELAVHTVGGVIAPGATVMRIVPGNDVLVVEAQIAPSDIDQVTIGQTAVLRFTAFSQKSTPELSGVVARIAADITKDEKKGLSFYVVRIILPEAALAEMQDIDLVPGMPVEVYLQTGERTALSYLVKPLRDQIARAMRED